ncbi:site-specific integrase [Aeromonas sp. FDAARGOS 1403]|uniref:tyrosine-type recombinase/integrase n=1 Tax=Aeromonas TaxID=642 RepID=UPI001C21C5F7|nr:site-specific integrase [Aeromonas sp. FDAARGOS 1403]QXA16782.1 site-specific integrase [Aeromonas sp. FDAARGOS 1403]
MALVVTALRKMLGTPHGGKKPIRKVDRGDGLNAFWHPSGSVSFVFRYRFNGKNLEVTLGKFTNNSAGIDIEEARRKTEQCKGWLAAGHNPALMLKLAKEERLKPVTVEDAICYWLDNYAAKNRKNAPKIRQQFQKWIFPKIGYLPLIDCETRHWLVAFDECNKQVPVTAGMLFQISKQALKYCRVRCYAVSNVLNDLTIADVGKRGGKRDRVLSLAEIHALMEWIQSPSSNTYYRALSLLLLSFGARTREVRESHITEWDLAAGIWTVPIEHSKTDHKIVRAIPERLKPMLAELIATAKKNKTSYLLGQLKKVSTVATYGHKLSVRLGHSPFWTFHDLRRSLATHLTTAGIAPHVIEIIAGHSLKGVMSHYIHDHRLSEQKATLELWQSIIWNSTASSNIIHLNKAAGRHQ